MKTRDYKQPTTTELAKKLAHVIDRTIKQARQSGKLTARDLLDSGYVRTVSGRLLKVKE